MSRAPARRAGGPRRSQAAGTSRTARIGGMEITYDDGIDDDLRTRNQPLPLFPSYNPGEPRPLSKTEREEIANFLRIRDKFRDGPLYATMGRSNEAPEFNPFEGMGAYSQKYVKRARTLPRLNTKARAPAMFPQELWKVVDPSRAVQNGVSKGRRQLARPLMKLDSLKHPLAEEDDDADDEPDEDNQDKDVDDNYESDDSDDMAADYNAEQYFDNGGDEAGDDLELDDGDGGDFN